MLSVCTLHLFTSKAFLIVVLIKKRRKINCPETMAHYVASAVAEHQVMLKRQKNTLLTIRSQERLLPPVLQAFQIGNGRLWEVGGGGKALFQGQKDLIL